jgi:hypothetical protein
MNTSSDIEQYNNDVRAEETAICKWLYSEICKFLPESEAKIWHGHPVWFLSGNPVVGYSSQKAGIQVLFWSGQSFITPGLTKVGKYQAAGVTPKSVDQLETLPMSSWLSECQAIQWDYANLPKRKTLDKLTRF